MQRQNENAVQLSYITQIDWLHKRYKKACLVEAKPHSTRVLFLVSVILIARNNYFLEKESDRAHQRAAMGCCFLKDRQTRIKSTNSDDRAGVSARAQSHSPYERWVGQKQGQWLTSAQTPRHVHVIVAGPRSSQKFWLRDRDRVNGDWRWTGDQYSSVWSWTEYPELSLNRAAGPWDRVLGGGPRQHWVKAVEVYLYPQNWVRADGAWTKCAQAESRQSQALCTKAESSMGKRTSHRGHRSQQKQQQDFFVEVDQKTAQERNITLNPNKCFYQ